MSNDRNPEEVIRGFYAIFNDETPELFEEYVAADYADYGHQAPGSPPQGIGPEGARANYDEAAKAFGKVRYDIDALVAADDSTAAVVWTGHVGDQAIHALSIYRLADGKLKETKNVLY
jgi:hypothetical protein